MSLGPSLILVLKASVTAATLLWLLSLAVLWAGNTRLHGRINRVFAALTLFVLLGLEAVVRILYPLLSSDDQDLFSYFDEPTRARLRLHLCFAVPAALVLPAMLYTGLKRLRRVLVPLGLLFAVLWTGAFLTGVVFLPHRPPDHDRSSTWIWRSFPYILNFCGKEGRTCRTNSGGPRGITTSLPSTTSSLQKRNSLLTRPVGLFP
jgi:hypothetical protein